MVEEDKKYIKALIDIIDRPDIIRYLRIVTEDIIKEVYGEEQKKGNIG